MYESYYDKPKALLGKSVLTSYVGSKLSSTLIGLSLFINHVIENEAIKNPGKTNQV